MNCRSSRILFFIFILIGTSFPSLAQNTLSNLNQALRYSRYSRLGLKILPVKQSPTSYKVQFQIEKIEENPAFNNYSFTYSILDSYEEEILSDNSTMLTQADLTRDTDRHWVFEKTLTIPENKETAIALLAVQDTRQGDEYYYSIDIKSSFVFDQPTFGAYYANNVGFDQNYLNAGESLLFKTSGGPALHSFYYPVSLEVPYPPMETKPAPVPRELEVVDEGEFLSNVPKSFDQIGYYFIQNDTSANSGLVLKTTHEAFPKVRDWEEMIDMVKYISTRKEHENLVAAEDKKKALDAYWLSLTRNPDTAKELIREYFRQVEFANILFTDFKEGWKTDKGMIYIVMGPPQEVNFYEDREVWTYGGSTETSKIRFNFVRVKNILSPHYYTLNRSRAYQPVWFKNISIWRSGKMAF
ncbi:GWxTD domain-containing protein [Algoriphagus halophytocola]|uniref:GWxTD domain-containing protein n=1 Tax=Algoriphagus halophytocola TaxID=2991499 RepID=A0ABY6MFB0_9BACT|nr:MULTISPECIES: GWxTD domain-containing protein [unclassified Algoriphagus]UZD22500.1 GWxTD domain-containing protein [Algoriphagus sp. TR-M5]WBL43762.1 GWxTD domain-containing protein [Algoriphagus sp. TR-M9]